MQQQQLQQRAHARPGSVSKSLWGEWVGTDGDSEVMQEDAAAAQSIEVIPAVEDHQAEDEQADNSSLGSLLGGFLGLSPDQLSLDNAESDS